MAKSVPNPEFVAIASAQYALAGLARRAPGQRSGRDFPEQLPAIFTPDMLPAGWRVELLGTGPGYGPGGNVVQYDHLAVHGPDLYVYPAYRVSSACNSYAVCRELQYVGRQG